MIQVPCYRGYMQYESGENDEFIVTPIDLPFETVAHGLSQVSRFGGQTRKPYSVGEHSVRLGWLLRDWGYSAAYEKAAHLHDAPECLGVGDFNSFVKKLVDAKKYRSLDRAIASTLWVYFGCQEQYGLDWAAVDSVVTVFDKWLGHHEAVSFGFHVPAEAKFDPDKYRKPGIQPSLLQGYWSPAVAKEAMTWNWSHADGRG